jgi:hypothetical protein
LLFLGTKANTLLKKTVAQPVPLYKEKGAGKRGGVLAVTLTENALDVEAMRHRRNSAKRKRAFSLASLARVWCSLTGKMPGFAEWRKRSIDSHSFKYSLNRLA